jgi:hypothetical protein
MEILNRQCRVCAERVIGPAAAIGVALLLGHCLTSASLEQPFDEYQVKAAFLYNFAKFVQWPSDAFQTATEPMAICVLGQDPFGRSLVDIVSGRAIEGRSIIVRHIADVKQVAGCHVLYIASTENKHSPAILADIKAGILTVGDSDTSGTGVVINFRLDDGKVRFEIDVDAAEREKLQISSRLLSLAHIIESGRK